MKEFQFFFEQKLLAAGWKIKWRGPDMLWRKPGEVGIIYDTAEAVSEMLKNRQEKRP